MMEIRARRYAQQDRCSVEWGNIIGGYSGQSGTYRFASEDDAAAFAKYAERDDFPSLAAEDLKIEGIPEPESRHE